MKTDDVVPLMCNGCLKALHARPCRFFHTEWEQYVSNEREAQSCQSVLNIKTVNAV